MVTCVFTLTTLKEEGWQRMHTYMFFHFLRMNKTITDANIVDKDSTVLCNLSKTRETACIKSLLKLE